MDQGLTIVRKQVSDLRPDPNNSRRHGEANLHAIRSSLARFGQAAPIVVRNGVVLAGNATLSQAAALGWAEIDCVEFSGTDQEATALALALNRSASLAEWDDAQLAESLAGLDEDLRHAAGFVTDMELEIGGGDDDDSIGEGESPSSSKKRFVFTPEEVIIVEKAISETDKRRRGAAIAEICRQWLEGRTAMKDARQ